MTPNSGCLQKGQVEASEINWSSCTWVAWEGGGVGAVESACSGGWGSARLICTKHSEQIDWSQQRVRLRYGG